MEYFACRICGNTRLNMTATLSEVMFQTWEKFEYIECGRCGCFQIIEIPSELSRYYPENYYSKVSLSESYIKKYARSASIKHHSGNCSLLGRMLNLVGLMPSDAHWLSICKPSLNWRILDVGCGNGARLKEFAMAGFRNLSGVDPFVDSDIKITREVTIRRGELGTVTGQFDLIMFHHSLEHVPDPVNAVSLAASLLASGGWILIRVPVMGKYAWREYGIDWVQLDAPRHLHIFTERAIHEMASIVMLSVVAVVYDSFELQFTGSEKVRSARSSSTERIKYSSGVLRSFRRRARKLNIDHDGDQACFLLRGLPTKNKTSDQ